MIFGPHRLPYCTLSFPDVDTVLSKTQLLWGIMWYKPACARHFFRNANSEITDVLGQLRELVFKIPVNLPPTLKDSKHEHVGICRY